MDEREAAEGGGLWGGPQGKDLRISMGSRGEFFRIEEGGSAEAIG